MNTTIIYHLLGDRARYPLKFRPIVLITIPIVVADIKETKPQSLMAKSSTQRFTE